MRTRELKKLGQYKPICQFPTLPGEEWRLITDKSVPGVEPYYYISNYGRVFSCKRKKDIMNQSTACEGYHTVGLRLRNGTNRVYTVHRIMMIEFNCIPEYKEMQINHIDGNKDHNTIDNLEWCTPSENIQHAFDHGLKKQHHGEDCTFATITNAQAEEIAQLLLEQKYTHKQISEMTGVPVYIVHNISEGTTWIDVYDKYNLGVQKKPTKPKMPDEDLEMLCQYIQDNKNKHNTLKEVYIEGLKNLFGIEYNEKSMSATMSRILNHKTRRNIVDKYDF